MDNATLAAIKEYLDVAGPTLAFMLLCSVVVVALALERSVAILRARWALRKLDDRVLEAARTGNFEEARRRCDAVSSPWRDVFSGALDRALGRVKGEASMSMAREQKRAIGGLRSGVWILGTAGALMPFVGLLGTVVGVMASFKAMGTSGQGGFSVVSAGISEALIATAAGLFVAIEAVVLFNILQNVIAGVARDLALLVDEMNEIVHTRRSDAGSSAG